MLSINRTVSCRHLQCPTCYWPHWKWISFIHLEACTTCGLTKNLFLTEASALHIGKLLHHLSGKIINNCLLHRAVFWEKLPQTQLLFSCFLRREAVDFVLWLSLVMLWSVSTQGEINHTHLLWVFEGWSAHDQECYHGKRNKTEGGNEAGSWTTSKGAACQTVPIKVPLSLVGLLIQYAKVH